jgi:hypothetical protein
VKGQHGGGDGDDGDPEGWEADWAEIGGGEHTRLAGRRAPWAFFYVDKPAGTGLPTTSTLY